MKDLFGKDVPEYEKITAETIKAARKRKRSPTRPKGHFQKPGTGPAGETCGTCVFRLHRVLRSGSKFQKCHRARAIWTGGPGSDIRAKDAACRGWVALSPAILKVEEELRSVYRKLPLHKQSSYQGSRKVNETCEDRKTKKRRPLTIEEQQAEERFDILDKEKDRLYEEAYRGF